MVKEKITDNKPIQTACGGDIEDPQDYPNALYQGKRIYFCNQNCERAFHSNPDGFMDGEVDHKTGEAITGKI